MQFCRFCDKFGGKENIYQEINHPERADTILCRTKSFFVIPTLGQFVEGYLLIVPKEHFTCIGKIPRVNFLELIRLIDEVRKILHNIYGSAILMEHGPRTEYEKAGCCIDHAHLHVVPVGRDVDISGKILKHFVGRKIIELSDLIEQIEKHGSYLFFEDTKKNKWVFDAQIVPKQYLRRLLAVELGISDKWDWRNYPGLEEIDRTIRKLSPFLKNI